MDLWDEREIRGKGLIIVIILTFSIPLPVHVSMVDNLENLGNNPKAE